MIRFLTAAFLLSLSCSMADAQSGGGWDTPRKSASEKESAPSLAKIAALQDAVADAWLKMPLTQRRAIFVSAKPDTYGSFNERKSKVFKVGETLITYVEPIGYTWAANADGTYNYGIVADWVVKRPDGTILGGQEKFLNFAKSSYVRNQELMVTLSLTLDAIPPGDYLLEYKLHDGQSTKESKITQTFTIQP